MIPELTTLCYVEDDDKVLMLHRVRKEKDCNKDKWIGIGGHLEEGESPEECIRREALEETGLELSDLCFRGVVTFCYKESESSSGLDAWEYMYLFTAGKGKGNQIACNEGDLVWVPKKDIGSLNLWEGDKIFLDLLWKGQSFISLKLCYTGDCLTAAYLNENKIAGT